MDDKTETESVITSMTDVSIYHEFDLMIAELHSIQQLHHQTIGRFYNLSSSITDITDDDKIYINYKNEKIDLDDFLDKINMESLVEIKESGEMGFGKLLLSRLGESSFKE